MSGTPVIGGQELARRLSERAAAIGSAHGFQLNVTRMSFELSESGMEDAMAFGAYRVLQDLVTELSASPAFIKVSKSMSQSDVFQALAADTRVYVSTVEAAVYMGVDVRTLRSWAKSGNGLISPMGGALREGHRHSRWRIDDIRRALGELG